MSSKKAQKNKKLDQYDCAYCMGPAENKCQRCLITYYCSKECQKAHWKEGHKHNCVHPNDRKASKQPDVKKKAEINECAICLEGLNDNLQKLECGHTFHRKCIDDLRKYQMNQVCPLCRAKLPDSIEKQYDDIIFEFFKLEYIVLQRDNTWRKLTGSERRKMENILTVLNNLADQNDPVSQNTLGLLYKEGKGVKKDTHLANQYFVKGVMNDNDLSFYNLGLSYYFGDGIKKNFKLAEKYFLKSATNGHIKAQNNLGSICFQNKDYQNAFYWFKKAAEEGHYCAQDNLSKMYGLGLGTNKNKMLEQYWKERSNISKSMMDAISFKPIKVEF